MDKNKNIFNITPKKVIKYRCEKCNSLLFEGEDVSGKINIKCKHIIKANRNVGRHKCGCINVINGG